MAGPQHRTPEYRAERKRITKAQREGRWLECVQPICVMTSRAIAPDQPAHVAHDDSGTVILGPAHALCNTKDGGVRRHGGTMTAGHTSSRGGTMALRVCVVCGTHFTPTYSKQASCSRACGATMRKQGISRQPVPAVVTKRCQSCGDTFLHDGTPRTYCETCSRKGQRPDQLKCALCGTTFQQNGRGRTRTYCPTCSPPIHPYDARTRREVL